MWLDFARFRGSPRRRALAAEEGAAAGAGRVEAPLVRHVLKHVRVEAGITRNLVGAVDQSLVAHIRPSKHPEPGIVEASACFIDV